MSPSRTDTASSDLEHPEANPRSRDVQRRMVLESVKWFDDFYAARGIDTAKALTAIRPSETQIENAVATNSPFSALGSYEHFHAVYMFERYCVDVAARAKGTGRRVVITEIGTIHGILANLINATYPNVTYVFVDIPESLCLTAFELAASMSDRKFLLVDSPERLHGIELRDYDFVFVPSIFADQLRGDIDVVWTFHALGEMSNPYIALYYDLIQNKIAPRHFVHRSRFLNHVDANNIWTRVNENMAGVLTGPRWDVMHWTLEPEVTSCPYLDATRHPRYLEVVLSRRDTAAPYDKRAFLENIAVQSWVEILVNPGLFTMAFGLRPLRFDLSQTGTFAQFWDSIRCEPGRDNILMFMHYLDYCAMGSGLPYEEWFFYAAVILVLHAEAPDETSEAVMAWVRRRIAGSPSKLEPAPGFGVGYIPPAERIPHPTVHRLMHLINVSEILGL